MVLVLVNSVYISLGTCFQELLHVSAGHTHAASEFAGLYILMFWISMVVNPGILAFNSLAFR